MTTYTWPQTINGVVFLEGDIDPWNYPDTLPNLLGNWVAAADANLAAMGAAAGVVHANRVLAGPTTGSDAAPAYRALVAADINALAPIFAQVGLSGSSSGTLTVKAPAAAGTNTVTLPAGTTDFSATGGTSQVVKQTSAGGAFTVGQLAASDLSNGTTGTGNVALKDSPVFTTQITTAAVTSASGPLALGAANDQVVLATAGLSVGTSTGTTGGVLVADGVSTTIANSLSWGVEGGVAVFRASGANGSTKGTFILRNTTSNNSASVDAISGDVSGSVAFGANIAAASGKLSVGTSGTTRLVNLVDDKGTDVPIVEMTNNTTGNFVQGYHAIFPNVPTTNHVTGFSVGQGWSSNNAAYFGFRYVSSGADANEGVLGKHSTDDIIKFKGSLITFGAPLLIKTYTVATVPSASPAEQIIGVSDGTSNKRLAVSDGTNWRWPDGAIVS